MKASTAQFLHEVFEKQYKNCLTVEKKNAKVQKAYYDGILAVLEILATEAYTVGGRSINDFLRENGAIIA